MKSMCDGPLLQSLGFWSVQADEPPPLIRSVASGRWSDPATWEGGRVPCRVRASRYGPGTSIIYDTAVRDAAIRSIHVAGTLRFDPDRDTRLDVGLIKIQAGDDAGESGFDCEMHTPSRPPRNGSRPRAWRSARRTARSPRAQGPDPPDGRPGLDPEECPAIVCCGGRMDFHGASSEPILGQARRDRRQRRDDRGPRRTCQRLAGRRPGDHHRHAPAESARRR